MKNSSAIQYPAQTGAYRVKVKNGAVWQNYNTARLQISVGKQRHEGEKFIATMDWVTQRFNKIIICVNDTLQRFNYEIEGFNPEEAFIKSESDGREWIERHIHLFRKVNRLKIYRWEQWRKAPEFNDNHEKVWNLYKDNEEFKNSVDCNINELWLRKLKREEQVKLPSEQFFKKCRKYVLEETAIFSMMFAKNQAIDIYPGTVLVPMQVFQNRQVNGAPRGLSLGQFTRIDFARQNQ